ncbi:hypothetical protein MUY27_15035 [Mucilaginibacter sp. RS28]|uniref:Uncharacterized protein n=1 Tax=Mucilaginibacter straminoryzae TaxID=2932774 RepID=A0A9X1X4V5_9SPHI|nr:hypothetical protein [Mucilaginibacter straminoryzae]MCJ8211031.1 hypothetical protein [Mucilaginibacter straminoryzae]
MKRKFLICVFITLIIAPPFSSQAQTGIAVGVLLNQLMDRVENAIQLAENAGKGIIIQGGSTLYLSMENAKIAYAESLDKTFDHVDQSTQGVINQLTALTIQLERQSVDDVSEIVSKAQVITNSLPFSNREPQIAQFSPGYFAPTNQAYQVSVEIKGNFFYAGDNGFTPVLKVNNKVFTPVQNTTQTLKFLIPVTDLAPTLNNTFSYSKAEVIVPYKTGFIFTRRREADYNLLLGVLPGSPGAIKIKHKSIRTVHEEQRRSTQTWSQHSSNDDITQTYCSDGFPGWHIKDPSCVVTWSQGNENDQWSRSLVSYNPQVCYRINTVHHPWGTSGKVNFHFEFTIERDNQVEEWLEDQVVLNWGESKVFNFAPGTWTVSIDSFDGKHNEYSSTVSSNYLDVNGTTTAVQLQVKKPAQVVYP